MYVKLPFGDLNPSLCPPHFTSTYTYGVTIAPSTHTLRQSNTFAHASTNRAKLSFPLLVWIFIVVLVLIYLLLNKKPWCFVSLKEKKRVVPSATLCVCFGWVDLRGMKNGEGKIERILGERVVWLGENRHPNPSFPCLHIFRKKLGA